MPLEVLSGASMTTLRLAVAGRYPERHTIKQVLAEAKLDALPVVITASWLDCTEESDADLTDEQAVSRAAINRGEIASAHALRYFPSWLKDEWGGNFLPRWSPGRLIDVGMAIACGVPIIIVGRPEPSLYFRGDMVTACEFETLRQTVQMVLGMHEPARALRP